LDLVLDLVLVPILPLDLAGALGGDVEGEGDDDDDEEEEPISSLISSTSLVLVGTVWDVFGGGCFNFESIVDFVGGRTLLISMGNPISRANWKSLLFELIEEGEVEGVAEIFWKQFSSLDESEELELDELRDTAAKDAERDET
jgi:hypothetical protein